ncbi:MAG: hypothetical protein J6U11_05030 [Campylobacter sp.]|nr:hypothetical protein [Campylobacter sp.]
MGVRQSANLGDFKYCINLQPIKKYKMTQFKFNPLMPTILCQTRTR